MVVNLFRLNNILLAVTHWLENTTLPIFLRMNIEVSIWTPKREERFQQRGAGYKQNTYDFSDTKGFSS